VGDGDVVKRGQLLIKLDQTRSQSNFRENRAEYQALVVKADRLRAVVDVTDFKPDPELTEAIPRIVAQEMALFHSSKAQLSLQQEIAQQQLVQAQEELREESAKERQLARSKELTEQEADLTRPMVESGAVSQVEILRLEKDLNKLSGEHEQSVAKIERLKSVIEEARRNLGAVKLDFVNEAREELADTLSRMNALREAGAGLSDRVKQTAVRSPVNGTIKQLHYHTIGGVVLPGREIVEIVPLDDSLLVEVRIRPEDIAFLVPGQQAMVKFTAYDFAVYGGLPGALENIGVDTVMDPDGKPYYPARVRTGQSSIGQDMPIIPGMVVEVDILTGKKSILAYLLKPVLRAKQVALTER
jgi:adhesin transport system membrane fusion protein